LVILAKQLSTGLGWGRYLTRQLGFVLVSLHPKSSADHEKENMLALFR
jgi:hypothetical protein